MSDVVGLVVNPIAGIGGEAGLKGSDGVETQQLAVRRGARPRAGQRAALAIAELIARRPGVRLLTVAGAMGADAARAGGGFGEVVCGHAEVPSAEDTRAAARVLAERGVALLLFAGGDGTARDVLDVVGNRLPALGVPAGVKIHSAAFGVTPRAAGEVASAWLAGTSGVTLRGAEVVDIDEDALRSGTLTARLYGELCVPCLPTRVQQRKVGASVIGIEDLAGIAAEVGGVLGAHDQLVFGPGSTNRAVAGRLGVDVPLLGVNVLDRAGLVAADVDGPTLLALARDRATWLAVSPTGGQGFLLGRGNQQITPAVLRLVTRRRLLVLCTEAKLAALGGRPLLVDTGDEALDRELSGHLPVITGYGRRAMYPTTN